MTLPGYDTSAGFENEVDAGVVTVGFIVVDEILKAVPLEASFIRLCEKLTHNRLLQPKGNDSFIEMLNAALTVLKETLVDFAVG